MYAIVMEYREETGNAAARLLWSSLNRSKEVIPSNRLFAIDRRKPGKGPIDLLDSVPFDSIIKDDEYGWRRQPADEILENPYTDLWSVKTNVFRHRRDQPHDISAFFARLGEAKLTRDLGTRAGDAARWTLSGQLGYPLVHINHGLAGGSYLQLLDKEGKVIARFYPTIVSYPKDARLMANDKVLVQSDHLGLSGIINPLQPFEISASEGRITFKYGAYPAVTTNVLDPASNWQKPKSLQAYFWNKKGAQYRRNISLGELVWSVEAKGAR
jgi:hypothetical protein